MLPPAGRHRHLFPPAPRFRLALKHSLFPGTATKAGGFSTLFPAAVIGDLGHAPFTMVHRQ